MTLSQRRALIRQEALKKIVLDDLAGKMGMDKPAFDKWLEMPSAT